MDLTLTPEQEMVRTTAREFADREIAPYARDWDRAEEMDRSIVGKLAELGFLGAPLPEEHGDGWRLSGTKMFITNGTWAGIALVFARTGGEGPRGVSAFLVPTNSEGFAATEIKGKLGLRSGDTAEVTLDGVYVPDANRLGDEG